MKTAGHSTLRTIFVVSIVFLYSRLSAQESTTIGHRDSIPLHKDYVKMKNGDRVLGKILKIQRGDLYFDGDMTGDVKISLKDIEYIKGAKRLYRVDIFGAGEFVGHIEMTGTPGYFHLSGQPDSLHHRITDINIVMGFEKGFWDKIDGNLNFGYSFTKSSDITRFNLSNEAVYTSQKWQVGEYFSSIYTVGDGNGFERIDASLRGRVPTVPLAICKWKSLY